VGGVEPVSAGGDIGIGGRIAHWSAFLFLFVRMRVR